LLIYGYKFSAHASQHFIITFGKESDDVFAFTKNWAYEWNITKDDNGRLSKTEVGKITSKDTFHLYFATNCKTNVQGGYSIRYCYATKKVGIIILNFSDGLPAYASEFNVNIERNRFSFNPNLIYPEIILGEKRSCRVTKNKLTLYQENYAISKQISGYIDEEFIETTSIAGKKPESHRYYFRGYFKTLVKDS
jgi:hypothetical protein